MKKGDIVQLKSGFKLSEAEVNEWLSDESIGHSNFTVKEDAAYKTVGCAGEVELVVQFEETSKHDTFLADHFDVVLKAGEPDVNKLMEESVMAIAMA